MQPHNCPIWERRRRWSCDGCPGNKMLRRIYCVAKHTLWHTDPSPVEAMLAMTALGWAASFLLVSDAGAFASPRYLTLLHIMPITGWTAVLIAIGAMQGLAMLFPPAPCRLARCARILFALVAASVWTLIMASTANVPPISPFTVSCGITAMSAWWVFLRAGDRYHRG